MIGRDVEAVAETSQPCQAAGWVEQFVRPRRHLQSEQSGATGGSLCRTGGFSNTSSSLWPRLAARWVCTRRARSRIRRAISPSPLRSRRAASPTRWRASSAKAWASGWGARSSSKIAAGRAATSPPLRSRARRPTATPNVPTYAEAGYPNFEASSWVGVFAPANTSPEIVTMLNATIEEVMNDPALRQKLTSIGFDPIEGSQAQAETYVKAEVEKWGKMVKTLGLSIN